MLIDDIMLDVKAAKERDPAAHSTLEVLLLYQGVHALIAHRFAHWLYERKLFFSARLISQISRFLTGIEIHPGAKLGRGILIDHGSGVVIGETAEVGDNCTIYQGVTLGGIGTKKGKRHPTLGKNVTVGAGAKILGSFEVGDNCTIAANAVLLKPLQSDITVAGVPAKPVRIAGVAVEKKPHAYSADLGKLQDKIYLLERRLEMLEKLEKQQAATVPEKQSGELPDEGKGRETDKH